MRSAMGRLGETTATTGGALDKEPRRTMTPLVHHRNKVRNEASTWSGWMRTRDGGSDGLSGGG